MQNFDLFYGQKVYRYIDRQRYLVGLRPTMRPHPGETNSDFEERMERCVEALFRTGAVNVVTTYELRSDTFVECYFEVELTPELAPVACDHRLAGGNVGRGERGARRAA